MFFFNNQALEFFVSMFLAMNKKFTFHVSIWKSCADFVPVEVI